MNFVWGITIFEFLLMIFGHWCFFYIVNWLATHQNPLVNIFPFYTTISSISLKSLPPLNLKFSKISKRHSKLIGNVKKKKTLVLKKYIFILIILNIFCALSNPRMQADTNDAKWFVTLITYKHKHNSHIAFQDYISTFVAPCKKFHQTIFIILKNIFLFLKHFP